MGRVLLVDDEKDLTEACRLSLSLAGHDVTVAHDGADALEFLTKGRFDLVITDLRMPRVDGFTVLRWIVSHKPATKAVVLTGFGSPIVSDTVKRLGGLHCLSKPLGTDQLLETVRSVLGESGFSATVRNITLADYIQLCMYTGKTSLFEVSSGGKRGTIAVVEGTLTYAEQGDLKGEQAFFEIVSWEGGQITEKKLNTPLSPNVHTPGQALLLEALGRKDDAKAARQQAVGLPAPESPPPPEAPPSAKHPSDPSPSPPTDRGLSRGSQHAVTPAPPDASEVASLAQRLDQDRQVTEYGVFVEQDFLRYKRSVTGAILQAAPSLYLKPGDTLKDQLRCGALHYLVIHTKGGARYLVFDYLNARAVVGLRPDTRPEDFWKTFRHQ
jgi:DNA-binding response OmpR family regulator